ncbi:hypothetical protein ACF0H5_020840 [Mactra antiquata]
MKISVLFIVVMATYMVSNISAEEACEYEGNGYDPGSSFPSSDGCSYCYCLPDGHVECVKDDISDCGDDE